MLLQGGYPVLRSTALTRTSGISHTAAGTMSVTLKTEKIRRIREAILYCRKFMRSVMQMGRCCQLSSEGERSIAESKREKT